MDEGSRRVTISLETFIKRSWPLLAVGAVLLLAAVAGLTWFAVSGKGRKTETVSASSTQMVDDVATSTGDLVSRALDGMLVTPAESQLQPFAVMVENSIDARPLSGPAEANLVFEVPVEGGITRYLLVFDATTTVDAIGPVRSARPYYVDFADGLNAVYAHVGGSPDGLDKIKGLAGFRDLNEFFNGKYFWRSAKRSAPHNVFTRTDLLHDAFGAKNWKVGHFRGWHYKDDDTLEASPTSTVRGTDDGPKLAYGGAYTASWAYDRANNAYKRSEGGQVQNDQDGTPVIAKNIVLLITEGKVLDDVGRLSLRTTGKGKATVYRDGHTLPAIWRRTAGEHLTFEGLDGTDIIFDRGTTWVEVMLDQGTPSSTVK